MVRTDDGTAELGNALMTKTTVPTSEIFSASRHALGFYHCVANACRYSVPLASLRGQAIGDVLETVIANVVLALPSLSVGIVGQKTSKPYFVQLPSINLEHHFECLTEESADPSAQDAGLLSILRDQHDRPWPEIEQRPPWKVTAIVRPPASEDNLQLVDIVFAVHHSIADGRSTAAFHSKLQAELNKPTARPAQLSGSRVLTMAGGGKLDPPQEDLVNFTKSWSFVLRTLWRELGPAWLQWKRAPVPWTGKPITREPCRSRLRLVTIPAVAVPRILAACRAHGTTLTALLHALVLTSLARRVPPEEAAAPALRGSNPIDLRPFLTKKREAHTQQGGGGGGGGEGPFGTIVSVQGHDFGPAAVAALREKAEEEDDDDIWKVAAGLRASMKAHLAKMPADDIMSLLGWVGDWQKFWLGKVGKPRQDSWEVSNIGSMPGSHGDGEGWRIQRCIMSQGANVAGAAIALSVAGVTGGDICIVAGWQEGIVETEIVEGLADDLQRWLDRLGSEDKLVQ